MTLLVGWQKGHPVCKKTEWWGAGMVICLEQGADLLMVQLMPLLLTVSCFIKIRTGFTFLVPAHLGSPRKTAVKCVCVRVLIIVCYKFCHSTFSFVYTSGVYVYTCVSILRTVNSLILDELEIDLQVCSCWSHVRKVVLKSHWCLASVMCLEAWQYTLGDSDIILFHIYASWFLPPCCRQTL